MSCSVLREAIVTLENRIRGRYEDYYEKGRDPNHLTRIRILEAALAALRDALNNCTEDACE